MAKTNPIGVRFDEVILKRVMEENNLTSPQQVLNFLMDHYGEEKKSTKPSVKSPIISDPELNPYESYKAEIKNAGSAKEIEKIVRASGCDSELSGWHKEKIKEYGIEVSRTLDI